MGLATPIHIELAEKFQGLTTPMIRGLETFSRVAMTNCPVDPGYQYVNWWTQAIHGHHQNDFIMAAKTDTLFLWIRPTRKVFVQLLTIKGNKPAPGAFWCGLTCACGGDPVKEPLKHMRPDWEPN